MVDHVHCRTHQSSGSSWLSYFKSPGDMFSLMKGLHSKCYTLYSAYQLYTVLKYSTPTFLYFDWFMYSYSNYLRSYNCVILKPKLKSVLYKHQYSNVTRSSLLWWCSLSYFYSDISGQGTVGGNHPTSFNLWGQHAYTNRFC